MMASNLSTGDSVFQDMIGDIKGLLLPDHVRFSILGLRDCNASGPFSQAQCSVYGIQDEPYLLVKSFNRVFSRGISLMNKLKNGDINSFTQMDEHDKAAIIVLGNYLKENGEFTGWRPVSIQN